MATGRLNGTIAVLAETTLVLAILAGLGAPRAAELQTNQQLLDQRIDQLAAGAQNPAQPPSPGINFSVDQPAPAGSSPMTGSFPRSILLPGTNTSAKVYGEFGETLDYGFGGGAGGLGNGSFAQSPLPAKLGFEMRTPTPLGEARTVIEFDR